jgi:hypothetical protein
MNGKLTTAERVSAYFALVSFLLMCAVSAYELACTFGVAG